MLRELRWIHSVAEGLYHAYTTKDIRRYTVAKAELYEMITRLDMKVRKEVHSWPPPITPPAPKKTIIDPGASPKDFWGC